MKVFGLSIFTLVAAAALVAVLLQTTVFHASPVERMIPDLVLILCVYLGLHQHSIGGTTGAFLLGYFTDNFSGHAVGLHAFAMSLVFLLVYMVSRRFWMDNWLANVAVVFAASMLKTLTVAILVTLVLSQDYPLGRVLSNLWFEATLAALFTPLVFVTLDRGRRLAGIP